MIHTLFYFTTLISKIGKNLIYTILSILTINYFNKKIIKINNYLDRKYISSTFTFNLHYFMTRIFLILRKLGIWNKDKCIKIYFNSLKKEHEIPVVNRNGKDFKLNTIKIDKLSLDPNYDNSVIVGRTNRMSMTGPIDITCNITILPNERFIKVMISNKELSKINQKNIQNSYLISFSENRDFNLYGKYTIDFDKNTNIITIEDIIYDFILYKDVEKLQYFLNEIIQDNIQPW